MTISFHVALRYSNTALLDRRSLAQHFYSLSAYALISALSVVTFFGITFSELSASIAASSNYIRLHMYLPAGANLSFATSSY